MDIETVKDIRRLKKRVRKLEQRFSLLEKNIGYTMKQISEQNDQKIKKVENKLEEHIEDTAPKFGTVEIG